MSVRILYVEDDPINAFVLEKLLQRHYDFKHTEDGEKAVDYLKANEVEVVLMDSNLGGGKMDGIETMKYLRNNLKLTIPIFAVTSYALPEDEAMFLREGFNDFIAKPIDKEILIGKIQKVI